MPDATRITVGKNDEATVVAEQLIDADTTTIIFNIPRGAVFTQSLNNFKLLKREGSVLGKEIIIESEDPVCQEKAVKAGLEIGESVAGAAEPDEADAPPARIGRLPRGRNLRIKTVDDADEPASVRSVSRVKKKPAPVEAEAVVDADIESAETDEGEARGEPRRPARRGSWGVGRLVIGVIGAAAVFYVLLFVLPRTTITVEMKKDTWVFNSPVIVDKSISVIDAAAGKIPGQVFTQKNTAVITLPATGTKFVERKAAGTLTVYNAYSSQPQNIVANTRFVTASGVVFRITKALTIPGAKIENSKIIPSGVTAEVVADKAGTLGNVPAGTRLTIPGFSKTPKFNGFYGELAAGASGGFSGTTKVATEADIKTAKVEGVKQVEQLVRSQIAGQISSEFKTIEGATRFALLKQTVDAIAGADGTFTVTNEAQLSVFTFREKDLRDVLALRREKEKSGFKVESEEISYGAAGQSNIEIVSGRIPMPVTYRAELSHSIDVEALRARVAGVSKDSLRTFVLGTPGVVTGTVSLWPFYVGTVPNQTSRITIVVQ